jgi:hypothetical protein
MTFPVASTSSPQAIVPGNYVRLFGMQYSTPQKKLRLNGTYVVAGVVTNTSFTVAAPRVLVTPTWTAFGAVQVATPGLAIYNAATYRNLTHKKRGRPLYVPRGRR